MRLFITIAIIFSINLSVFSQEKEDSLQNPYTPARKTAKILANKTIVLNTTDSINPEFEVVKGKELVFEYEYRSKDYLLMTDDEYVERVMFKVIPKGNKFSFNTKTLKNSRLLYLQSCFCMDAGNYVIKSGTITGVKLNKTIWNVKIKFTYIARNSKNLVSKQYNLKYKIAIKNDQ